VRTVVCGTLDTKIRPRSRSTQRLSHKLLWRTLQNNSNSYKFK